MSYAEDMGYDAYDGPSEDSDTEKYEWEDANFEVTLIKNLDTAHIENIIRGIERGYNYLGQAYKLNYLKKELHKRKG